MVINVDVVGSDGKSKHLSPRVHWRCPEVFWKGAIHNYLSKVGTVHLPVVITYGYSPAHKKDPDRALRILLKEVARDPKSPRELFYLAREYVYRKDYISAVYWYNLYAQVGSWAPELAEAYLQLSTCLWYLYRGEEARSACMKAIQINANFKEAIMWMASISGPKNKVRWDLFATTASNDGVLFVR
jgi:tetratricopeptide (TPR) repeat protein